jgi:thioredoxin 1
MFDISCPACGETYHVSAEHSGRSLKCRRCERVFEIVAPIADRTASATAASSGSAYGTTSAARTATAPGGTAAGTATATHPSSTATAAAGHPIEVTDQNFEQSVLRSPLPVVVDFWASWCPPCRAIAPTIEQLAGEYTGRVTFAKLNADENPRTVMAYGVQGLPTLVFFKGGTEANRLVGAHPRHNIQRALDQLA